MSCENNNETIRVITPPIKGQGIKTKLVPWIKSITPSVRGRWIEPFLGTGVVAFNSGFQEALLCDINPHVIKFYNEIKDLKITSRSVRDYLEREGSLLKNSHDNGYAHFRVVRDRFNQSNDPLDFLFLSRAGFNGIMRFNRNGKWNVPFCKKPDRFSPAYITKIVNQVNNVACVINPKWSFLVGDFKQSILQATKNDIIYCDPPYIGRCVNYYGGWSEKDEQMLFNLLLSTPARFILSTWHHDVYRINPFIKKFWSKFNMVTKDHFYFVGGETRNRTSVVEALVFNF
jgi:DNA adenine methylase